MKSIIITGASGFVGQNLLEKHIKNGYKVYAIVRDKGKISISDNNLIQVILSMNDYDKIPDYIEDEIDYFYHLAWEGYGVSTNNPIIQYNNVVNSVKAYNSAKKIKAKKFIFTGTCHEYLKKNKNGILQNCSVYGMAKKSFKDIGKVLSLDDEMCFCSTIFSHVFGIGDFNSRSSYYIIRSLLEGNIPKLSDYNMYYDWTYIDNAIDGLVYIAQNGENLKNYYIGNDIRKFGEIIEDVSKVISPNAKLVFGEYIDETFVDYEEIKKECGDNTYFKGIVEFSDAVYKTAEWIKKERMNYDE